MVFDKRGIIILGILIFVGIAVIFISPIYIKSSGYHPPENPTLEDYKAHLGKPFPGPGKWAYEYFVQQQDDPDIEAWIMDAATSENDFLKIQANFILFRWGINRDSSILTVLMGLAEDDDFINRCSRSLLRNFIDVEKDSDILVDLYSMNDVLFDGKDPLLLELITAMENSFTVSSTVDPEDLEVHPQF